MMTKDDKLTLKVWETPAGNWVYAVYTGDGSIPGSLRSAGGGYEQPFETITVGKDELTREIMIRDCDHEWQPWGDSDVPQCVHCKIVDWREDG